MAFNLFPQTDFRQMDLNYVLEVSKQAAANLEEYAADKEQVVAAQAAAEEALAAAQQDIQTATQAAASAGQDAQTATQAAGTATQAAADAEQDAQTASAAAATATAVQESIPADYTTLSNDVDNLKSDLNDVTDSFKKIESANIYNLKSSVVGKLIEANGTISDNVNYTTSDYIVVSQGDTIRAYYVPNNVYPANMAKIACFDAEKNIVPNSGSGTTTNTFTVPTGVAFVRLSIANGVSDTFMLTINDPTPPTKYIAYLKTYKASVSFIEDAVNDLNLVSAPITKEKTDFWEKELSSNLFDKTNIVNGEFFNTNGSIGTTINIFRSYVELNGAGVYSLRVCGTFYGLTKAVQIPLYDENKTYIKTITGTTAETTPTNDNLMSLTINEQDITDGAVYLGYTGHPSNLNTLMVVKSATYPDTYIPYHKTWLLPELSLTQENITAVVSKNPLYGKIVIFDGDSICEGANSAQGDYGNGWAGRIGVNNDMLWHNTGVGGGTITAGLYFDNNLSRPRHWISRYIDTIYAQYPDLDYLILEGGTNDADNLIGQTAKIGEIVNTDYNRDNDPNHFNDETYCGALDTLFYKCQQYYPKKKVGFIIAQKMGRALNADGNPDPYIANRRHFFDLAVQACKKWGIPYIDLWEDGYLNPNSTAMYNPEYNTVQTATEHGLCYIDGQHLTAYGYDVISPKIAAWMKTL